MTVVWSRLPNFSPILGSERSVSSRHRYIAICRALTSTRLRELPIRSSIADGEVLGGDGHDRRCGDLRRVGLADEILEHHLGQPELDRLPVEAGERGDPDQRALELADVALDPGGDELEDLRRRVRALLGGLLAQDRDAGLQVGGLDVADQAPLEAGAQPVLERVQLPRRLVGADDDLLVGVVQGVEGVEELLLRALGALQELDVVDEQHVDRAVAATGRPASCRRARS